MSRLQKVKESKPELLSNEDVVLWADQADGLHDIKALYDTEGGKRLVRALMEDVAGSVSKLSNMYRTATHMELVGVIADMATKLDTAKILINSEDNLKYLDAELESALRE